MTSDKIPHSNSNTKEIVDSLSFFSLISPPPIPNDLSSLAVAYYSEKQDQDKRLSSLEMRFASNLRPHILSPPSTTA